VRVSSLAVQDGICRRVGFPLLFKGNRIDCKKLMNTESDKNANKKSLKKHKNSYKQKVDKFKIFNEKSILRLYTNLNY
jgi:hypothetical protein